MQSWKEKNPEIAFVPTMGALHEGHLSLVHAAKKTEMPTLVSVFVNPTQFSPDEDFAAYPRNHKEDAEKLKSVGTDAVWFPTKNDIYPNEEKPNIHTLPPVFSELEGEVRPTHFLGVAQVLHQFFSFLSPKSVFFGQKDFQQTVLVRWLLQTYFPNISLHVCPIIREKNNLAMSSRNEYLSLQNRKCATVLSASLFAAEEKWNAGKKDIKKIIDDIKKTLEKADCVEKIDYIEARNAETLEQITKKHMPEKIVFLLAAQIQRVRLLDNIVLS